MTDNKARDELKPDKDDLDEMVANWIAIEAKDPLYVKHAKMRARTDFRAAIDAYTQSRVAKVLRGLTVGSRGEIFYQNTPVEHYIKQITPSDNQERRE